MVLEKTLESPLDCKVIQPVHPKADQSWVLIGRTDIEAETPVLWPPGAKRWLTGKDPDAGRDWGQEEKGTTEDEMVGWHHCLDGHEFEQAPGVGDGLWSLVCCNPWDCKELDMTEQLNWTELNWLDSLSFAFIRLTYNPKWGSTRKLVCLQSFGHLSHLPAKCGHFVQSWVRKAPICYRSWPLIATEDAPALYWA